MLRLCRLCHIWFSISPSETFSVAHNSLLLVKMIEYIIAHLLLCSYLPERKILNGISFVVPAGKSVAIVLTSGSGNKCILLNE